MSQSPATDQSLGADPPLSGEVFAVGPVIAFKIDPHGRLSSTNDPARHLFEAIGVPAEGTDLKELIHPDDRALVDDALAAIKDRSAPSEAQFRLRSSAGFTVCLNGIFVPQTDSTISLLAFDVTSVRQRDRELQVLETRFRGFLEHTTDVIYTTDLAGNFLTINQAGERLTGFTTAEALTKNIADVIAPEFLDFVRGTVKQKLQGTAPAVYETEIVTKSGRRVAVEINSHLLYEGEKPVGLQGIARDISERKHALVELRASQERFVKAFAAGPFAMMIVRMSDGVMLDLNDAALKFFGYDRDAAIGRTTLELGIWPNPEIRTKAIQILSDNGTLRDFAVTLTDHNGQARDLILSGEVITLNGDRCSLWVSQDVTERNQVEQALRVSQERYSLATHAGGTGVWDVDLAQGTIYVDPTLVYLLGYPDVPDIDRTAFWASVVHPEDLEMVRNGALDHIAGRAEEFDVEHRARHGAGDWRWMHTRGYVIRGVDQRPVRLLGTSTDVNDRRLAENALRQSEERYRTFIENSMEAVWRFELEPPIPTDLPIEEQTARFYQGAELAECNDALAHMYGFACAQDMLGASLSDFLPRSNPDNQEYFRNFFTSGYRLIDAESQELDRFGETKYFLNNLIGIVENGRLIRVWGTQRDVTRRKHTEAALRESEDRLRQSQKMEAVGRLAGGVAHDFNNLLTGIIGYTDMTLRRLEKESPLRRNLDQIRRAADRAANLTHQLLAYSRRQILQPSLLDVNAIVLEMDQMLRRLIGEDIALRTNLGHFFGHIKADRGQLEQVLMNLAVNARDAMPKGGSLTLATCAIDLAEDRPVDRFLVLAGSYVRLSVTDTGMGMTEEVRSQIFEPFFTTKEVGKGTGLGLATVYGIVKQSGGYITVESEPGAGTVFNIYLPRVSETPEDVHLSAEVEVPRGSETILLIEDDPTVRSLARDVLAQAGYQVLEARNGTEALTIGSGGEAIQLLLTDVVMPQFSGRELADRLTAMRPELRVLYMSGYTDDAILQHGVLEDGLNFIQKPFSPDSLARMVRVVLDQ